MVQKVLFSPIYLRIQIFFLCGCLVFCSSKESTPNSHIFANLLAFVGSAIENPNEKEEKEEENQKYFVIDTVSPRVLLENTEFVLKGKSLSSVTEIDLLGDGAKKYVFIVEQSDSKILLHVSYCPTLELNLIRTNEPGVANKLLVPCLGSFRYSFRNLILNLGEVIEPIPPTESVNLQRLRSLGEVSFSVDKTFPTGLHLDQNTGEIFGTPTETTGDAFQTFSIVAQLKEDPLVKINTQISVLVVTEAERENRICRPVSTTSTCRYPAPYSCANAGICFQGQFSCLMDIRCGL
ncbi:Ig domain-containing protein [Leptospira jelokensis]|uniref:Uncharacterized protein n=1 Tax=Leptospira jelokensis TaxID=2484931 RepID=A0A4Z1A1B2_9LEPT|nr:Ig domain-containing protein [Leptospira jelokensis]TGL72134.1 hypothetical protein EHQ62_04660 [Leptospira jelokensis]